jgi:hypothetical protein
MRYKAFESVSYNTVRLEEVFKVKSLQIFAIDISLIFLKIDVSLMFILAK